MSDFRDVVQSAITYGFYLDSCGEPERHYTWGSWIDLCGMSIEEAMSGLDNGGGGNEDNTGKTKNTITFVMQKGSDNEYSLYLTASQVPNEDVTVSFTMDGEPKIVTIPAGTNTLNTGFKGKNPSKPYAVIASTTVSSDDEEYSYTTKNSVKTGIFTLTLTINGQKETRQVPYGEAIELTAPAEREGYDFVWKDGNGNIITGGTYEMPEANAAITGTYVAKEYTLTYTVKEETLEGSNISVNTISTKTATVKFGTAIWNTIKNETPSKTGYTLDGWKSSDGGVTSATTMPAKDFEVYNTYKLNKYVLKFIADASEIYNEEKYFGQEISAPEIPAKTGYSTIGWDSEVPATMPASNKTFNAVYEAIIYYIRYNVDGSLKYTEEHIYGDTISIRADEVKEGYTFSGWNPSTLPATMPDENIEVNGTFQINTYHFALYVDGNLYFEKDYEYGETIDRAEITEPVKEGYTFIGWDPEIPDTVPANDLEISAKFQINQHILTYYVDGSAYSSFTYDYGTAITAIDEPVKEGYTFSGWDSVPATMPDNDVDVNGTFSINSYLLTYYVDNELVSSSLTEYGAVIIPLNEPVKEGYTFSGWDEVPETMPARDVDINGTFTINSHVLEYYVDNLIYTAFTYDYGTQITAIEQPEIEGHTFSGWTALPETMPDEDVRADGWQIVNQYTLSFVIDGEPYTAVTGDYGTAVPEITVDEKEGYTFSGWDKTIPETFPAEDIAYNGTYDINYWVATYYIDNEEYSSVTYQYGETIDYPNVPKEGFVLKWNKEYLTMPDNDVNITGIYEERESPKMIYYGCVLKGTESNNIQGLSSFEYENGVEVVTPFILPGDPAYAELETDEDFEQWDETHMFNYYVLVPSGKVLTFKNASNKEKNMPLRGTVDINGDEYDQYYSAATTQGEEPSVYNMKITITEN